MNHRTRITLIGDADSDRDQVGEERNQIDAAPEHVHVKFQFSEHELSDMKLDEVHGEDE